MPAYEFLYQEDLYRINDTILIAISEPWESLKESDKDLLNKILGAVKIPLDKVQILHASVIELKTLIVNNPAKVIVFGTIIKESAGLYSCQQIAGTKMIVSEALSALDDAKKKSLWGALKQMFA